MNVCVEERFEERSEAGVVLLSTAHTVTPQHSQLYLV